MNQSDMNGCTALSAIYFDKLAEFFCRLWHQLHEMKLVRHPSPYESYRGIHGPGRGMPIDRVREEIDACGREPGDFRQHKIAYIGEIVEKLQFGSVGTRALFNLDREGWRYDCRFTPGITDIEWESWLSEEDFCGNLDSIFLTPQEASKVELLGDAIRNLSEDEIRTLGTHSSPEDTIRDLDFNREKWNRTYLCVPTWLETGIKPKELSADPGKDLEILASEIERKSITNKAGYASGWEKMINSLSSGDIGKAFLQAQKKAEIIWNDSNIALYAEWCWTFVALSAYVHGLLTLQSRKGKRDALLLLKANEAASKLNDYFSKFRLLFIQLKLGMQVDLNNIAKTLKQTIEFLEKNLPPLSSQKRRDKLGINEQLRLF